MLLLTLMRVHGHVNSTLELDPNSDVVCRFIYFQTWLLDSQSYGIKVGRLLTAVYLVGMFPSAAAYAKVFVSNRV